MATSPTDEADVEQEEVSRWEYTIVDTVISAYRDSGNQVGQWLNMLNELGNDGWEVVSDTIIYGKGSGGMQWPVLLLKRPRLE